MVKTCSMQARGAAAQQREQIRTAYTINRVGRQGMGVLPQISDAVANVHEGALSIVDH